MRRTVAQVSFLIMILLALPAFSQERIYNSQWLDLTLTLGSSITLVPESSNYDTQYVSAKLSFLPLETWRQDVQSIETNIPAVIGSDNILYEWYSPNEKTLDFSLESKVRTLNDFYKINSKIRFPITSLSDDLIEYTKPSEKVDSDNSAIIAKANQLAQGEDDLFMVVHKIAEFVHDEINYNLSTINSKVTLPASYVLQSKEGVCDEISVLFMALVRALGIPARFVSGISYTNSDLFTEKWGAHGWAEVYFPGYGWVPFDVTYDELGFIDASHVTSKISIDPDDASVHYQWKGRNVDIQTSQLESDVKITGYGKKIEDQVKLVILPLKPKVGLGSYNLVELQVENLMDYYVTTTVYLAKTSDLSAIEPYVQPILLKPGQKKKVFWTLNVNPGLDDDYIYTFPILAYTIHNTTVETEFSAEKGGPMSSYEDVRSIMLSRQLEEEKDVSRDVSIECVPDKEAYFSGDNAKITCSVKNQGNFPVSNLKVCHKESCHTLSIGISAEESFDFVVRTTGSGKVEALITANNEEISRSTYASFDVLDNPAIKIAEVEHPETAGYGEQFRISFLLEKESYSDPQDVKIMLIHNGLPQSWEAEELTQNRKMIVEFSGGEMSVDNDFRILVQYEDKKGESYEAESLFNIKLADITAGQRIVIFFKDIVRSIERIFS